MPYVCVPATAAYQRLPHCGFEAKPVNNVVAIAGELRELDRKKRPMVNPIEICGQFKFIGLQRGYKPGWAYHRASNI